MNYQNKWRDKQLVQKLLGAIKREAKTPLRLMEVCGTHTVAIFRHGLRQLLPSQIELISGPGCPVCVTPQNEIDLILELAQKPDVIVATFGDLLGVPGTDGISLKTSRANIQVVYSPMDALLLAQNNPQKKIIFPAIGFETTAPNVSCTIQHALHSEVSNFFIIPLHKLIPPAMKALLADGQSRIDGFICPGHVSVIIGCQAYNFISDEYGVPAAVAGFEPVDILGAVLALVRQHENGQAFVENCYPRAVNAEGNQNALTMLDAVFDKNDSKWRGLGVISQSGLRLRPEWQKFDACKYFGVSLEQTNVEMESGLCACGQILKGIMSPAQCPLFRSKCNPSNPVGPCMVSSEGSCAAYFKYCGNLD